MTATFAHPGLQNFDESDLLPDDLIKMHDCVTKEITRRGGLIELLRQVAEIESGAEEIATALAAIQTPDGERS